MSSDPFHHLAVLNVRMCAVYDPALSAMSLDGAADYLHSIFPWWRSLFHVLLLSVYEGTPEWRCPFTILQLFEAVWAGFYPPKLFLVHDVPIVERWYLMHWSKLMGRGDLCEFVEQQLIYTADGPLLSEPFTL